MLIPYKKNHQKIAMGLLSFMPAEKDLVKLRQTMEMYEKNPDWKLYVWKESDIIGVIGVVIDNGSAYLQHICVNPSHRKEGIGKKMLEQLKTNLPCDLIPTKSTESFMAACQEEEN
ncbi:GNAT family N-acetyltransferase [Bacillus sp. JCM 19034]|uniref:GNAT family N-acetyltransferase n=1 Tax=Bacillus sp. JCM 19034 TaxID=1481928 RepID=UPI0007866DF6|nr:GNAT family N-acetyltransferase [Bacillus sp. JCM 19034]